MKNVKVKSKQNEREITITIYANGEEADKIVRYHNTCMICKETTVNDEDFGTEYICPLCAEWLNEKLGKSNQKDTKEVVAEVAKPVKKGKNTKGNRRYKNRNYSTKFQVLDVVNYQNLLGIPNIPEKTLNLIVSFIIEGRNTANKIHKVMKDYALETIYIYLTRMAKVGMLYNSGENKAVGKGRYNQIFKVMRTLNYTQVDEIVE